MSVPKVRNTDSWLSNLPLDENADSPECRNREMSSQSLCSGTNSQIQDALTGDPTCGADEVHRESSLYKSIQGRESSCCSRASSTSTSIIYESQHLFGMQASTSILTTTAMEDLESEILHIGAWTRKSRHMDMITQYDGTMVSDRQQSPGIVHSSPHTLDRVCEFSSSRDGRDDSHMNYLDSGHDPHGRFFSDGVLDNGILDDVDFEEGETVAAMCELAEKLKDGLI